MREMENSYKVEMIVGREESVDAMDNFLDVYKRRHGLIFKMKVV